MSSCINRFNPVTFISEDIQQLAELEIAVTSRVYLLLKAPTTDPRARAQM